MLRCNIHFQYLPRRSGCYIVTSISRASMLLCSIQFKELQTCSACYVVTSVSSNFQDVLHATLQQPFQTTSKKLWMLLVCCNIRVKPLPRRSGCYVVTSIFSIFQDVLDAILSHPSQELQCYFVACNARNFKPVLRATLQQPFSSNFQAALDATCML